MPPAEARTRVLVVDDHPMVREGLRSLLRDPGIEIVGESATGAGAVTQLEETPADVVLLDMRLADGDALAVLPRIKELAPRTAVLVVSIQDDLAAVRRAIAAGAAGYILKTVGRQELLAAIQAVRHGECVVDPTLLRAALSEPGRGARTGGAEADQPALTAVELDVLRLIATGLTNPEIAGRLHWPVSTVKKYVQRVLEKLAVSDRTQAAVVALRRGLLG